MTIKAILGIGEPEGLDPNMARCFSLLPCLINKDFTRGSGFEMLLSFDA